MAPRPPLPARARLVAFGAAGVALVGSLALIPHAPGAGTMHVREVPAAGGRAAAGGAASPSPSASDAAAAPTAGVGADATGTGTTATTGTTPTDGPASASSSAAAGTASPTSRASSSSAAPIRASAPSSAPSASPPTSDFVTTCGSGFCLEGKPWRFRSASVLGMDGHRSYDVASAEQAGLTVLRLVNMLDEQGPVSGATDAARWADVDADIAAAHQAGLHVELDLSSYRNLLANNGVDPYAQDWASFLSFVTNRVNTVTGVRYADDPTIALIAIAGEVQPPAYGANSPAPKPTAAELYAFFARTEAEIRADDPNHLRSTGGMLFLADPYSGISWQQLLTQSGDDVCAMHVYSQSDLQQGMSNLASWCAGRPWIVEEFGMEQSSGDSARASFFDSVFQRTGALGGAGDGLWNLGPETTPGSHDVNPQTPDAWQAVVAGAS